MHLTRLIHDLPLHVQIFIVYTALIGLAALAIHVITRPPR